MEKHLMIKIFGKVQGVSFRYYAREEALKLNLCGFVRNEFGGAVCIEAEGEEKN
ncbi:acylphosphatase, partial [Patescibacteria group bacterium]|nr:acylphosphatase [Patescibacteria group bacterium]